MRRFRVMVLLLVACAGAVAAWRWQRIRNLRAEIAGWREPRRALAESGGEKLRSPPSQLYREEDEELRATRAAVARLRAELAAPEPAVRAEPLSSGAKIPASGWSNAGRSTPWAATETALWAAAGGEVDALADALYLDPAARAQAEAVFARVSAATREQLGTPERFVALFTIKSVPMGTARVLRPIEIGPDDMTLVLLLESEERKLSVLNLALHRCTDGWKLAVPERSVEVYGLRLAPRSPRPKAKS